MANEPTLYQKAGKPDRVAHTEAEHVALRFEGYKAAKAPKKDEKPSGSGAQSNTGGGNQSADARNKPTN